MEWMNKIKKSSRKQMQTLVITIFKQYIIIGYIPSTDFCWRSIRQQKTVFQFIFRASFLPISDKMLLSFAMLRHVVDACQ